MLRYIYCIGTIAHISCVSADHDFIPPGGHVGQIRVANGNKKYVTIRYHLGMVQLLPPMKLSFQIASTITNQRNNLFIKTASGVLTVNQYRLLDRIDIGFRRCDCCELIKHRYMQYSNFYYILFFKLIT